MDKWPWSFSRRHKSLSPWRLWGCSRKGCTLQEGSASRGCRGRRVTLTARCYKEVFTRETHSDFAEGLLNRTEWLKYPDHHLAQAWQGLTSQYFTSPQSQCRFQCSMLLPLPMAIICNVAVPLRFFFSIMMPPIRIAPFKILSVTRPLSEIGLQIFFFPRK